MKTFGISNHLSRWLLAAGWVVFMPGLAVAAPWLMMCESCGKAGFSSGKTVEYDLHIREELRSPAGKALRTLTVNGGLPGPTLRFEEGDVARIRVHNHLKQEETSVHWHGLLLPNAEDGVPHVTTPPILPGKTHTFEFKLSHAGTYWYHSHTHLQEQIGTYGSIVVLPRGGERVKTAQDHVLVLSDWTNEKPEEVHRTLSRGSDYYGLKRGNPQSLLGAWQAGKLKDYWEREWTRMEPMDVSDVGYDAFLINGQQRTRLTGKPGEKLRLRLINAGASTYFYVTSSTGPLTIVAADGPAVEPVAVDRLFMGIAETYDVVVTVPLEGEWELRATAQDGSGHASAYFGSGTLTPATDPPKPDVYSMEEMLDLALEEQEDDPRASLNLPRPGSPYRLLRAVKDTTLPRGRPVREITMRLTGDMQRYVWSFDGKTMAQSPYVRLYHGEIVRLELVNDTMMHHPIHLHGHFMRLVNDAVERSPLKHTVDVPPMSRRTLEFEANEREDWMFHCHILYHMMSGMGRVFSYDKPPVPGEPPADTVGAHGVAKREAGPEALPGMSAGMGHGSDHAGGLGEHGHDHWFFFGAASVQSHMSEGMLTLMNARHDLILAWEIGWEGVEETEYEVDLLYQRYVNPNLQIFGGVRLDYEEEADYRAVAGVNYRLPLMVWASASVDSEGDVRLGLAKELRLTPRLSAFAEVQYDTGEEDSWEWTGGLEYTLTKRVSLTGQYHSDYGAGGGLLIRF